MNQKGTWAKLFEVQVNANTPFGDASNEYLTDYPKQITYSGNNYRPFPIVHTDIPETTKPEQSVFTISIANIDRAIANYLESGQILGNSVKITWLFLRENTEVPVFVFDDIYRILSAEIDDSNAVVNFEVGSVDVFAQKIPKNRYQDFRCEFVYKSIGFCDYGRDEFEGVSRTQIDKTLANNSKVIHGWRMMNAANFKEADIDRKVLSNYRVLIDKTVIVNYSSSTKNTPFLYRLFDNLDFEIEIKLTANFEDSHGVAMLCSLDSDTSVDWLRYMVFQTSGVRKVQLDSGDGNVQSNVFTDTSDNLIIKLKKTGALFEAFHKTLETDSYGSAAGSINRTDLNGVMLRCGLMVVTSGAGSNDFQGEVDYWRLLSGGLPSCDRTFSGSNGCSFHDNQLRFGGYVGILHSALVL